jgi:hypothetical protein
VIENGFHSLDALAKALFPPCHWSEALSGDLTMIRGLGVSARGVVSGSQIHVIAGDRPGLAVVDLKHASKVYKVR